MRQKGSALLLIPVVVVLVLSGIGWFLIKNKQITLLPWGQIHPTSTPTSNQSPTGDLANWKTYTNTKYKFSFKYPQNYNFEEQDVEIGVQAWAVNITDMNSKEDKNTKVTDIQGIGAAVRRKNNLSFQEWINNECPDTYNLSDIQISSKSAKKFNCRPFGDSVDNGWLIVAIDNGNYIYTLTDVGYKKNPLQEKYFDQILSTFKFIDNKGTEYTCPKGGWIDCMPILTEEAKKACSKEAMEWYKKNCPDFKGGAL